MDILAFLNFREPILVPIYLALLALAFSTPLYAILRTKGYIRKHSPMFFFLAPIAEELVLRLIVLQYLLLSFEPLTAILISTLIYVIYADFVYGPPFMADALVNGVLFGFVFLQFGIVPVVIASFLTRPIRAIW